MFDPIVTSADVRNGKPAPDLFEFALKRHGVGPLDALIFEDSLSGLEAAKAAGVPAIKIGPEGHQWQHFLDIIRILP